MKLSRLQIVPMMTIVGFAFGGLLWKGANAGSHSLAAMDCVNTIASWWRDQEDLFLGFREIEVKWAAPLCDAAANNGLQDEARYVGYYIVPLLILLLEDQNIAVTREKAIRALQLIQAPEELRAFVQELEQVHSERFLQSRSPERSNDIDIDAEAVALLEFKEVIRELSSDSPWYRAIVQRAIALAITDVSENEDHDVTSPHQENNGTSEPENAEQLLLLASSGESNATDELLKFVHHEDLRLRTLAIRGLSTLGEQRAVPVLSSLRTEAGSQLATAVLETLTQFGHRVDETLLVDYLLGKHDTEGLTENSTSRTSDEFEARAEHRFRATIDALITMSDRRVVPYLITALEGNNPIAADRAARALTRLGGPDALIPVLGYYGNDGARARHAIDRMGDTVAETLVDMRNSGEISQDVILHSVPMLIRFHVGKAASSFAELAASEDVEASGWGTAGLAMLGDARSIEQLLAMLDHEIWKYETPSIVAMLLPFDDSRVHERILELLISDDLERRVETLVVIAELGAPWVVPRLVAFLDHDDESVRQRAIDALGELGDHQAIDSLFSVFSDRKVQPILEAEKALEDVENWVTEASCDPGNGLGSDILADPRSMDPLTLSLKDESIQRLDVPSATVQAVSRDAFELLSKWAEKRETFGLSNARDNSTTDGGGSDRKLAWLDSEYLACARDVRGVVEPIKSLVDDSAIETRVAAATALAKLGVYGPLVSLTASDNFSTQFYASNSIDELRSSKEWEPPRTLNRLTNLMHDVDWATDGGGAFTEEERSLVREALVSLVVPSLGTPAIDELLQQDNPKLRLAAAEILADTGDPRAVEVLIELLDNEAVMPSAAVALGALGDSRAVPPLVDLLSEKRLDLVGKKHTIATALGELGDPRGVGPILQLLDQEYNYYKATNKSAGIITALGKIGEATAIAKLRNFLEQGDRLSVHDRAHVVVALFRLGDKQAVEPLLRLLRDADDSVREIATAAVQGGMDSVGTESLVHLLSVEDHISRLNVVKALGKTGHSAAISTLEEFLEEGDRDLRTSAAEALGEIGSSQAVAVLVEKLEPRDWFTGELFDIIFLRSDGRLEELVARSAGIPYQLSLLSQASIRGVFAPKLLALVRTVAERGAFRPRLGLLEHVWRYRYRKAARPQLELDIRNLEQYFVSMEQTTAYCWLLGALLAGNAGMADIALQWAANGFELSGSEDAALHVALSVVQAEALAAQGRNGEAAKLLMDTSVTASQDLNPIEQTGYLSLLQAELKMTQAFLQSRLRFTEEAISTNYEAESILKRALRLNWIGERLFDRLYSKRLAPIQQHNLALESERYYSAANEVFDDDPHGIQETYGRMLLVEGRIRDALSTGNYDDFLNAQQEVEKAALEALPRPSKVQFASGKRQAAYSKLISLRKEVAELESQLNRLFDDEDDERSSRLRTSLRMKHGQLDVFVRQLKREYPIIASMWAYSPVELAQLSARLDLNMGIVQYLVMDDTSYAFVVRQHNPVEIVELPTIGERCVRWKGEEECVGELRSLVNRYRALLARSEPSTQAIGERQRLSELFAAALLRPISDHIKMLHHIVLVPNNDLHRLPFGALPWDGSHLIEHTVLTLLPAVSLVGTLVSRPEEHLAGLLAFGNPIPDEAVPELRSAEAEVEALRSYFPDLPQENTHFLIGERAHRNALLGQDLGNFLLHFAVHAESGSAEKTRLLLTGGDVHYDEVTGLNIRDAPLVVLSACETGLGERLSGDQVYSLANGFLLAQARSVLFSLWLVNDPATTILMREFYNQYSQGTEVSQALAEAQRALITQGYPPFFWAGFVASELSL